VRSRNGPPASPEGEADGGQVRLILISLRLIKKQSSNYDSDGISGLSKEKYLEFLENFFSLAHLNAKKTTQMAFINANWPPARRAYASERGWV